MEGCCWRGICVVCASLWQVPIAEVWPNTTLVLQSDSCPSACQACGRLQSELTPKCAWNSRAAAAAYVFIAAADLSNYSAWHYRTLLLPRLHNEDITTGEHGL
jgi:hypothetical protein